MPGLWGGLPVAPALVPWRIEQARDGRVVIPERSAFDVRRTLPSDDSFWRIYARGTRQNMTTFGSHRFWRQPGLYLYELAAPLDTARVRNGIYAVVVSATDTRGNHSSLRQVFTVRN